MPRTAASGSAFFTGVAGGSAGAGVGAGTVVSAEHELRAQGLAPGALPVPLIVSIPVDPVYVANGVDPRAFAVQTFDTARNAWVTVNGVPSYDAATRRVSFEAPHLSTWRVIKLTELSDTVQRYAYLTDRFYIEYAGPKVFGQASVLFPPDDASWQARGGSKGSDKAVPDYVEDLGRQLESAMTWLLGLRTSSGAALFPNPLQPGQRQGVLVTHVHDASGDSDLGGPMRIRATLSDPTELKTTVAHELAHVLQGRYYNKVGGHMNRWFVEATANLWSARASALSRSQQIDYYSKELDDYLTSSIDVSSQGSYYAVADFLNWLEGRTGKPVAVDAMATDSFWDLTSLATAVKSGTTDLGGLFTEYVLGATVGKHDMQAGKVWTQKGLGPTERGWRFEFRQEHLSARAVQITTKIAADGLLVAVSGRDALQTPLKTYSYTGNTAIADPTKTLEAGTTAGKPVLVRHFGAAGTPGVAETAFRQVIVNPKESENVVGAVYTFDYYLLTPPQATVTTGRVSWTFEGAGIPSLYSSSTISGFNVYVDGNRAHTSLLPATTRQFEDTGILTNRDVRVTVVDRFGNEWPEPPKPAAPFDQVTEVCASFGYKTRGVASGVVEGPFTRVQCVTVPSTATLTWTGSTFSTSRGDISVFGTYNPRGASGPQIENVTARAPLFGRYAKPPALFQIFMREAPRDSSALIRFRLSGASASDKFTITYQPEDSCFGSFCEARVVDQIVPGSVTVWLSASAF